MTAWDWVKAVWLLTMLCLVYLWQATFGRKSYVGYYDWPQRSLKEYQAAVDAIAPKEKS